MQIDSIKRVFIYKDKEYQDPNETLTEAQVLDTYSEQFPELINARVEGPEIKDGKAVFEFKTNVGTKG